MAIDNPYDAPAGDLRAARRSRWLFWLATLGVGGLIVVALLLPMSRPGASKLARRVACAHNLRHIAQALQAYDQQHGSLPPACTRDAEGRPLHSWRTLILPYLEERGLYESIDLSKPWDDPANASARQRMPHVYRCPGATLPPDHTAYMVVVSPEGCFRTDRSLKLAEVQRPAQTLLATEFPAQCAVHWMAPEDADEAMFLAPGKGNLTEHPRGACNYAYADGSVAVFTPTDTDEGGPDLRRSLLRTDDRKIEPVD